MSEHMVKECCGNEAGLNGVQPWDQQPGETAKQYERVKLFLGMGPGRSLKAVAEHFGVSLEAVQASSYRHHWFRRARAYDGYLAMFDHEARERALSEVAHDEAQRWVRRQREGREVEWELSKALLERARDMLMTPMEDTRWSYRDIMACMDMSVRLSRYVAQEVLSGSPGQPQEAQRVIVEYTGDGQ